MRGTRVSRWLVAVPMSAARAGDHLPVGVHRQRGDEDPARVRPRPVLRRRDSLRWDNIATAWTSVGMGTLLPQLGHRGDRRGGAAAAARLDGRLRAEPAAVPRLAGAVPGVPRGAVHPVPGDHGAARADHGRHRTDRHLPRPGPRLRGAVPAVHDLPDDQLLPDGIPPEIVDAARIDGNSLYGVYRGSCCRSGAPALLSVGILNALFCWNDVLIALLMMPSAEHRTLMVGVTVAARPVLGRHPHLRGRRADRRGTGPGCLPVLPAPDRRRRSPPAPRKADMRITGYRTLTTVQEWGRPVGDANGVYADGGRPGADRHGRHRRGDHRRRAWARTRTRLHLRGDRRRGPARRHGAVRPHAAADLQGRSRRSPSSAPSARSTPPCGTSRPRRPGSRCGACSAAATARVPAVRLRSGHRPDRRRARRALRRRTPSAGLRAAKLKGGLDVERDLRRLLLVRDVLTDAGNGLRPGLMLDANECWTRKQAVRHVRELERTLDLTWIEEPVRRWDADGHGRRRAGESAPRSPAARTSPGSSSSVR